MPLTTLPTVVVRGRSGAVLKSGPPGVEVSLGSRLLEDAFSQVVAHHGKWHVRLGHMVGHKIDAKVQYDLKHKFYNEKGLTAVNWTINGGIMLASLGASLAITATTSGAATPVALAALAAGTWGANQVADAVTAVIRNHYRQKRMRRWLDDFPTARREIESKGENLQLIQDACDSIRRAVDHYRKAGDAALALKIEIVATQNGQFTNCSELVAVAKRQMKWLHEVQKTELYLIPCLDLAILLKNTQKVLVESWGQAAEKYRDAMSVYLLNGNHANCGSTCYGSTGARVPTPRKPLKGAAPRIPNGLMRYGEKAELLESQLEQLLAMREVLVSDIQAPLDTGGDEPVSSTRDRFEALITDAARHYDQPSHAKRSRHFIKNAWTRRTSGELAMGAINRGSALAIGVGTSVGGHFFSANVITPHIVEPIKHAIQIPHSVTQSLEFSFANAMTLGTLNTVVEKAPGVIGSATGSAVKQTAFGVGKGAWALARLGAGFIADKTEQKLIPDEPSDVRITEAGKNVGDNIFKKAVRHLQQADAAFRKVVNENHTLDSCGDALTFGAEVGEFVWHMEKSIRYLDDGLQLVHHMVSGVTAWNALEAEVWQGVRRTSMHYLSWRCAGCECHSNKSFLQVAKVCYGPGDAPHRPKKRM